jgi:hypothetical protein
MKNFIIFSCVNFGKFYRFFHILMFKEFKRGGVRAEPLYEVNFLFFYFL